MANLKAILGTWLPVAFLTVCAPLAAAAQDAPAAAPAPPDASAPPPGGAPWAKLCNTDPSTKKDICLVIQEIRADTGQFIASATIRTISGDNKVSFIAAVPVGMLIQPGLRLQIDDGKQIEVKYGICFQNACYGELDVDDAFVQSLKSGSKLTLMTLNQQAKPVNFPMTLAGFTKAYDGDGLNTAQQEQRQSDLADALAKRAETARQKLIEQQQKEGGGNN